ncbi:DJ-1/PfpI family protein [Pseudomonas lutea]|jgi:cyclohexyl-isocyanide hydratase|uniref:Dimethylglycine dehydrogenase n=1 Tax=Pseudomonas lutea TaxID=243924 RepID=A0A9X0JJA8_9PSED|nr:DJ-1/PfpI family protein [Pseudomonas lutea]KGF64637.1 dimethylglycine dehydrogenase [Pseudomonas lutea]
MTLHIGLLVFPKVQQLDLTGPYDVFATMPGVVVHLVWKDLEPLLSSTGLTMVPTVTFADCPDLDVICVPGGVGVDALMEDPETLAFIRHQASTAQYVTSVCTGALVLGAAGLLKGRRATTHWASHSLLEQFGAIPVKERVVRDGNLMTGGGVTAGIDFALTLIGEVFDADKSRTIQLQLEYAPAPPFDSGRPDTAPANVLAVATDRAMPGLLARRQIVERVTASMD